MTSSEQNTGLQLRSLVKRSGELELSLVRVPVAEPAADEVIIRVEATPINPSDLGLLFAAADLTTATVSGTPDSPIVTARIPEGAMKSMKGRLDQSMPVGNEGAGVVVAAGTSREAQDLLGKTVAILGGGMYAQYHCAKAAKCVVLPADCSPADGAAIFVNPLTVLSMVDVMRREGHTALVNTAAASSLGQMLNRLCLKDGIGLVNIVRTEAQVDVLRDHRGRICVQLQCAHLRGGFDPGAHGDRRHAGFRRHWRRHAGRTDTVVHGVGDQQVRQGIQPLRLSDPQAGLYLWQRSIWGRPS